MTLQEIADVLGITRQDVLRIEVRALAKLRRRKALAEFEGFAIAHPRHVLAIEGCEDVDGRSDKPRPGVSMPAVRFSAEGDDDVWTDRMWRAYTGG